MSTPMRAIAAPNAAPIIRPRPRLRAGSTAGAGRVQTPAGVAPGGAELADEARTAGMGTGVAPDGAEPGSGALIRAEPALAGPAPVEAPTKAAAVASSRSTAAKNSPAVFFATPLSIR